MEKHNKPTINKVNTIIKTDTITERDTMYVHLNSENVLKELKRQEVPHANIVLAQAKHESGMFKSKLCREHNNLFGIKHGNSYARYNSWDESIADYKKRISSRYKKGDYYDHLIRIGYAEDPNYIQLIKKYV